MDSANIPAMQQLESPSPGMSPAEGSARLVVSATSVAAATNGVAAQADEFDQIIARRAQVIEVLKTELIRRLNLPFTAEDLHEDISLLGSGLGLDSLDALEIVLCIENCFRIKIPDDNIAMLRSINTVVDFIIASQDAKGGKA